MQSNDTTSVGEQVVSSTLWLGSWRWTERLIGLLSVVILARLLLPEDFGIVATATIVVTFFTFLLDLGTDKYLIRHENPRREDYDTAWTLRLLMVSAGCLGISLAAAPAADYFGDQRLQQVLYLLAAAAWLSGFGNIGLTMYRRELRFRPIALIGLSQRLCAAITTVGLAFWLRNYWAMVIGEAVFFLVGLVLSYTSHGYRPRFSLARLRRQWDFCKWILVQNLALFLKNQGDNFVIVRFFGIDLMGVYSMAMRIAALPTQQAMFPVIMPVYSGLAKKQHDPAAFDSSFLKVIGATASLMFPAAALFACLAEPLVLAVLGERWSMAIPLVAPLTLSVMLAVVTVPAVTVLTIRGRVRLLAGLNWLSAIAVVAALIIVAQWRDIELLVWVRVFVTAGLLLVYYSFMVSVSGLRVLQLLDSIYRPLLASLAMAIVIVAVMDLFSLPWIVIAAGTACGGMAYLVISGLLWRLAGSPNSGEVLLLRKLSGIAGKIFKPRVSG